MFLKLSLYVSHCVLLDVIQYMYVFRYRYIEFIHVPYIILYSVIISSATKTCCAGEVIEKDKYICCSYTSSHKFIVRKQAANHTDCCTRDITYNKYDQVNIQTIFVNISDIVFICAMNDA